MGMVRRIGTATVAFGSVPVVLSAVLATLASRPKLAAKVFGGQPNPTRVPADVGLESSDVLYAPGCSAWWIPGVDPTGSIVIAHGFETSDDPRATDPGPRLELATHLVEAGFNCMVISLGYGSGAHLHSGGALEARDITEAVRWAGERGSLPVGVVGFSAGGNAAVAATPSMDAFAVVTDSSFVDFGEVVVDQGSAALSAPPWLFALARPAMRLATGHAPVDLEEMAIDRATPMLHIHGDADQAIDVSNLARLAAVTGGEVLVVGGADHIESLVVDPERYVQAVVEFLHRSLLGAPLAP